MERKIKDFGVKLDGARKNKLKKNEELPLPEPKGMENFLLISRDNIWPETNGEELVSAGIPQGVAYWREQIRKAVPLNPEKADKRSMINYFNVVTELRDKVNQINYPEDVDSFLDFLHQHYLNSSENTCANVIDSAKDVISQALLEKARTEYNAYERKAEKLLFGIPKKEQSALQKQRKKERQNNKANADSSYIHRKKPFPIPKLSSFARTGPAHLPEGVHAEEKEFLSLGIRSVEFGQWMSDSDAQAALDQCYSALRDLACVLDIEAGDISLGQTLALSFGARGYGETLADYKAEHQLISLPNGNGNGFFAHAWAFALDDYIKRICGESFSGMAELELWQPGMNPIPESVKEFLYCIKRKTITITAKEQNFLMEQKQQENIQRNKQIVREMIQSVTPKQFTLAQKTRWDNAVREVYDKRYIANVNLYSEPYGVNPALENLSAIHKEITGHSILKRKRASINYFLSFWHKAERPYKRAVKAIQQIESTDFHQASCELQRCFAKTAHGEYFDFCEEFARAFDCYIADKLQKAGIQNPYLTAHSEEFVFQNAHGETLYAFPRGEEREQLNRKFDKLIREMKEHGLFHQPGNIRQAIAINEEKSLYSAGKTSLSDIRKIVAEQRPLTISIDNYRANAKGR